MSDNPALAVALALLLLPVLLLPFLPSAQGGGPVIPSTKTTWTTYTVRAGDTLSGIAQRQGIPLEYIIASNEGLDPSRLRPGQALLLPRGGVVHTVKAGQTLADIAKTYEVTEEAIRSANGIAGEPVAGVRLLVMSPAVVPQATAIALGKGTSFSWPARGTISSPFGPRLHPIYRVPSFHAGIDIVLPEGTPVYAAASGRVARAEWHEGYGLLVVIAHKDGFATYYAHLSRVLVTPGQFVEAGQVVALSGNTGLSTGPHLHFEIRRDETAVDPLHFLP